MEMVNSADGTAIAYEAVGSGPAVILVGGAFCDRNVTAELATALSGEFTAVSYDRRGRGGSGDTAPGGVRREIEDIEALIRHFGDSAFLFGISSGAALALLAAAAGAPVSAVAAFEPPYKITADAPATPPDYTATLTELIASGRNGDAVAYFITEAVGQPPEAVEAARQDPSWGYLEAMAPSLLHDARVMGDDSPLPPELKSITVPALTVYSNGSPDWLTAGAKAAADVVPNGAVRGLDGVFHEVPTATLAPVLAEFYRSA